MAILRRTTMVLTALVATLALSVFALGNVVASLDARGLGPLLISP